MAVHIRLSNLSLGGLETFAWTLFLRVEVLLTCLQPCTVQFPLPVSSARFLPPKLVC